MGYNTTMNITNKYSYVGRWPSEITLYEFVYMVRDTIGLEPIITKHDHMTTDFTVTFDESYAEGHLQTIGEDIQKDIQRRTGMKIYRIMPHVA